MTRPNMPEPEAAVQRWLTANDIDEWIPAGDGDPATVQVDQAAGTITYRAYLWVPGKRGWNADYWVMEEPDLPGKEQRTVPLLVPLTDDIRAAAAASEEVVITETSAQ